MTRDFSPTHRVPWCIVQYTGILYSNFNVISKTDVLPLQGSFFAGHVSPYRKMSIVDQTAQTCNHISIYIVRQKCHVSSRLPKIHKNSRSLVMQNLQHSRASQKLRYFPRKKNHEKLE